MSRGGNDKRGQKKMNWDELQCQYGSQNNRNALPSGPRPRDEHYGNRGGYGQRNDRRSYEGGDGGGRYNNRRDDYQQQPERSDSQWRSRGDQGPPRRGGRPQGGGGGGGGFNNRFDQDRQPRDGGGFDGRSRYNEDRRHGGEGGFMDRRGGGGRQGGGYDDRRQGGRPTGGFDQDRSSGDGAGNTSWRGSARREPQHSGGGGFEKSPHQNRGGDRFNRQQLQREEFSPPPRKEISAPSGSVKTSNQFNHLDDDRQAMSNKSSSSGGSNPFGDAKPVDTRAIHTTSSEMKEEKPKEKKEEVAKPTVSVATTHPKAKSSNPFGSAKPKLISDPMLGEKPKELDKNVLPCPKKEDTRSSSRSSERSDRTNERIQRSRTPQKNNSAVTGVITEDIKSQETVTVEMKKPEDEESKQTKVEKATVPSTQEVVDINRKAVRIEREREKTRFELAIEDESPINLQTLSKDYPIIESDVNLNSKPLFAGFVAVLSTSLEAGTLTLSQIRAKAPKHVIYVLSKIKKNRGEHFLINLLDQADMPALDSLGALEFSSAQLVDLLTPFDLLCIQPTPDFEEFFTKAFEEKQSPQEIADLVSKYTSGSPSLNFIRCLAEAASRQPLSLALQDKSATTERKIEILSNYLPVFRALPVSILAQERILFTAQAEWVRAGYTRGDILMVFKWLFDNDLATFETFMKWKKNTEKVVGKPKALLQVTAYFKELERATMVQDESEEEEEEEEEDDDEYEDDDDEDDESEDDSSAELDAELEAEFGRNPNREM